MPAPMVPNTTLPWQSPDGTRFMAALAAGNQRRVVRVDVYNGNNFLETLTNVTDASVSVDITATTRRTCKLTIDSRGLDYDNLVPVNAGDLLHPATGNELRIFRGFRYADGTQDMCALGVFRMTKPVVTDTGSEVSIGITGNDRSAYISRIAWTAPYVIQAGTDLATAIQAIIANRWGTNTPLLYSMVPTNPVPSGYPNAGQYLTVNATTLGTDLTNQNDPWADVVSLAAAGGMDVFFDPQGIFVMKPIVSAATTTPSFPGLYEEGVTCTFNQTARTLDETTTYNGVLAIGSGTAGPPVQSQSVSNATGGTFPGLWNQDPSSPTYYDPGDPSASSWGPVPLIIETSAIPGYQSVPFTGTLTSGTDTITSCAAVSGGPALSALVAGTPVTGPYIPDSTIIVSYDGVTTVTISANATQTATGVQITGGGAADTTGQAQAKINSMAQAQLELVLTTLDAPSFNAVPNPALYENDTIPILRTRMGFFTADAYGNINPTDYLVQSFTIPLEVDQPMPVAGIPVRQP